MSYTFSGENCRIFIEEKGGTETEFSARLTSGDITLPSRNVDAEQTMYGHIESYSGYAPGNISLSFVVDEDSDLDMMSSFVGSQATSSGVRITKLNHEDKKKYKVKFLFENYTDAFGTTVDSALAFIYYDAVGFSLNYATPVDGVANGTLGFRFVPINALGSSNVLELEANSSAEYTSLQSIESSYDTEMGY